jgi:hypothetical protein
MIMTSSLDQQLQRLDEARYGSKHTKSRIDTFKPTGVYTQRSKHMVALTRNFDLFAP